MIEYRYGILSQLISEIDNYYQKTFAQFQKEALDLAKQNSSGDFEVYYTILQSFDSEDERISSLCKEVRKILFCSIFSYYEGCINAIIKYYKIETEAQQVQKLYDAISRTYEKRYLVNDLDIEANLLDYVNNFCRLLRNYFMHGDLSDNIIKKKLDCYVRNNDGVKLLDNYFIEIESKYNPQNEMFRHFRTKCSISQNETYLRESFSLPINQIKKHRKNLLLRCFFIACLFGYLAKIH